MSLEHVFSSDPVTVSKPNQKGGLILPIAPTGANSFPAKCLPVSICSGGQASVVSHDDEHGFDLDTGLPVIQRTLTYSDGNFAVLYFQPDGVTLMPTSTTFTPSTNETVSAVKFMTDTVTGAFREVTEKKDLTAGTVSYYDESGATTTASANEIVRDYVEPVALGNEVISVTGGTPETLSAPAEARYAYANVNGSDAMYAFGVAPVASIDHRVSDGGRMEFRSLDRITNAQIDALDGTSSLNLRFYYYNTDPEIARS